MERAETNNGRGWDLEADVIVIGSGAAGLPAAIKAVEGGASVIVVETNYDIGGHAILSGGHMALGGGASLWGLVNQTLENGATIRTQRALATKYNYVAWKVESPIFPLVRATGFNIKDWQDLILVNQVGKRFYDETKGDPPHGNLGHQIDPYTPNDYRNSENIKFNPTKHNFFNAAMAMNEYSEQPDYCAGPMWAIFDADAVQREGWTVVPPYVDPDGYFFTANTLTELAAAIDNEYQPKPMRGATLQATVERYNSFVDV